MPTPTGYTSNYTAAQIDTAVGEHLLNEIQANSDLNSFTTAGVYLSYSSAVTDTLSNLPPNVSGFGFRLDVIVLRSDRNLLEQRLTLNSNPLRVYYRRYSNGWNDWYEDTGYGTSQPYRFIMASGTAKYYKICTITNNRKWKIQFTGCTSQAGYNFDITVEVSNNTCVAYRMPLDGDGYGTSATTRCTFYYDGNGTLYLKTSTYCGALLVAYGINTTNGLLYAFEEISSIPSGTTYVDAEQIPISSFANDANYVAGANVATVYSGSSAPSSSTGNDGDIYIQTS